VELFKKFTWLTCKVSIKTVVAQLKAIQKNKNNVADKLSFKEKQSTLIVFLTFL